MACGVYEIVNIIDGERYIGGTANFARRWALHRTNLKHGKHHSLRMQRAWDKDGEMVLKFHPLLICAKKDLRFYEQRALDVYLPEYNASLTAGSRLGMKNSAEATAKTAAAHRGKKHSPEHSFKTGASWRGKKRPEETGAKISLALKGKKKPPRTREHCENLSKGKLGKKLPPRTPEHCANISKSKLGKALSPEHCTNISVARRNFLRSIA